MNQSQSRLIIYTGKGGVGKTSISASTGLLSASKNKKTLVISADSANSLGDAFEQKITNEPLKIEKNLWVQECDVYLGIEKHWSKTQEWARDVLNWQGIDDVIADELLAFPGMQELTVLLEILEHFQSRQYDVIVVDCAPTGDTFKLLSLPEAGAWWMDKIFPWSKRINKIARPISRLMSEMPLPNDDFFDSAENIFSKIEKVQQLLSNHKISTLRLVTTPEKMVIDETQRAYNLSGIFGYLCDLVVCNRMLPPDALNGYFSERSSQQDENIERIKSSFSPIPIKFADFFKSEIGKNNLLELGANIFGSEDPSSIYFNEPAFKIYKNNSKINPEYEYCLELKVSNNDKNFTINRSDDNLIITISGFRKIFLIPERLKNKEIVRAELKNYKLKVFFGEGEKT